MECMSFAACGKAKECNPRHAFSPSEAQRSGFVRKRRSDGMHELCRLRRSEGMQSATRFLSERSPAKRLREEKEERWNA